MNILFPLAKENFYRFDWFRQIDNLKNNQCRNKASAATIKYIYQIFSLRSAWEMKLSIVKSFPLE